MKYLGVQLINILTLGIASHYFVLREGWWVGAGFFVGVYLVNILYNSTRPIKVMIIEPDSRDDEEDDK